MFARVNYSRDISPSQELKDFPGKVNPHEPVLSAESIVGSARCDFFGPSNDYGRTCVPHIFNGNCDESSRFVPR
jgi:hypothetical protein